MYDALLITAIVAPAACIALGAVLGAWLYHRASVGKSPLPPVALPTALRTRAAAVQKPDPDAKPPRRSRP